MQSKTNSTVKEDSSQPMNTLLKYAILESIKRNQTMHDLSAEIGISYVYLMALARGKRPAETMARRVIDGFSRYLKISVAQAYLFSGALKPSDFLVEESAARQLEALFVCMRADNEWNAYLPTEIEMDSLNLEIKTLIGLLYEKASGTSLLAKSLMIEQNEH